MVFQLKLAKSFSVFGIKLRSAGQFNYEELRVAYFNNNLNRLKVGLCECGKRPWQKITLF